MRCASKNKALIMILYWWADFCTTCVWESFPLDKILGRMGGAFWRWGGGGGGFLEVGGGGIFGGGGGGGPKEQRPFVK